MQTALRKMGNSTGLIVPRTILNAMGVTTGSAMELRVEDGKLIATPVERTPRDGWALAAQSVAEDRSADEWQGFASEGDADLTW
ncbi:AbrB/MazE/SpoVT family DNA-binding domain-containing protein [Sphingomonas hengshuiensis]|uniref:SpoVT-AbrB domain-containing protein n=1 Tax=Sphingomonas hengshuiensis TaxID=1609977 RepID=A0A7U4JBL2_9SPHN|nr:AbrB/MazE/SpoVT family DNA-binding domain-containing protein [Sphingomonas hengshuiensis]AJP73819.1 hypothetical protein TS85_21495 [Sphingomonas hengshuiensis]